MQVRNIEDKVVGTDWYLPFVVSPLPTGVAFNWAQYMLKVRQTDADEDALIVVEITDTSGPSGVITHGTLADSLVFLVPEADNEDLHRLKEYYYRVIGTSNDGTQDFTDGIVHGTFIPQ